MKTKFGNWIFHYRNFLFPVFYLVLFIPSPKLNGNEFATLIIGLLIIVSGMSIRCATIGLEYILRGGFKRTIFATNLVTGGIYKVCRNPMYLGNLLILLGFGIYANSVHFTFIIFPLFIFIYWSIIQAEEEYLTGKFGKEFEDYKQKVNSILPSFIHIRLAFKNQRFNWKNVIFKEYNSIFVYIFGLLLLSLLQQKINVILFTIMFILSFFVYAFVKILKLKKMNG